MGAVGQILILSLMGVHLAWALVKTPSLGRSNTIDPVDMCREIKFVDASRRSATRESVLRDLCEAGVTHVELDDKMKQFAIFNLHRDNFEDAAKWHSGDAKNVIDDPYWTINDVEQLKDTKYHWYTHGLPMWPLPHQAISNTTAKSILPKKKPADWPNYGMATPVYFAAKAWRNQAWSAEEFFQQQPKNSPFKSHKDFHKLAKEVVEKVNGQQVESYSDWPFLRYSLLPMVKSMMLRNKGLCPDELYVYTRVTPCHPTEARQLTCVQAALEARNILTQAGCRATDVIVGYTQEYNNNAL